MYEKQRNRIEKIKHLRVLLRKLGEFHTSKKSFVKRLNNRSGKSFNKNIVSRIISGEITFRNNLSEYLDLAIECAQDTYIKYREEKQKHTTRLQGSWWIEDERHIIYQLNFAENLRKYSGSYSMAFQSLRNIQHIVESLKFRSKHPYEYALFQYLYCKIKIVLGVGQNKKLFCTRLYEAIDTFIELKEYEKLLDCYDLLRVFYRQTGQNSFIINFRKDYDLLSSIRLKNVDRDYYKMQIKHQEAMSLIRLGESNRNQEYFDEALRLLIFSNDFFGYQGDENWYRQVLLRLAELYVKDNEFHKADKILGPYEDFSEMLHLNNIQQIMFFRINCEKYAKVKNLDSALKNYKAAVHLSLKDNLKHEQLLRFTRLRESHTLLKQNLPPSVYSLR